MQGSKLYVGNLSYSTTRETLEKVFSNHGTVKDVKLIEGKGFGFVEMSSPSEAESASNALNNTQLDGRSIKVNEAQPPKPRDNRSGGGGGYRGGNSRGY